MKAYLVSEKLHNFERNQEPLKSMGIGVKVAKDKFIDLFPKSSDFDNRWEDIKGILYEPTTKITSTPDPQIADKVHVTISLPEHKMNPFFFDGIRHLIDSHSPKVLYIRTIGPKKMVLSHYI